MHTSTLRIHITGASGTGTTTLGSALAARLDLRHLDTDDFYWQPSDPPFQRKRPLEERRALLGGELESQQRWVLSGSLCSWGEFAIPMFDLVIFLHIPTDLRLERLAQREREDYGDAILPGGAMRTIYTDFMEWAARYDTAGPEQRSLLQHEKWLAELPCPVLRMEGDMSVEQRVHRICEVLDHD